MMKSRPWRNRETASNASLVLLPEFEGGEESGYSTMEDALEKAGTILSTVEEIRHSEEHIERLNRECKELESWGDFNPEDISMLREKGIPMRLFSLPPEKVALLDGKTTFTVHTTKSTHYLAALLEEDQIPDGISELPLPEKGLTELRKDIDTPKGRTRTAEGKVGILRSLEAPARDRRPAFRGFDTVRDCFRELFRTKRSCHIFLALFLKRKPMS